MRFDAVLIFFLLSLSTMAVVHYFALEFYLYWTYLWFDIPMHFLGGVTIALGVHTPLFRKYVPVPPLSFVATCLFVLLVGVAWEVFEWYAGLVDSVRYIEDTALDIVMDLAGGVLGFYLASTFKEYDTKE